MFLVARLIDRVDNRLIIMAGLLVTAVVDVADDRLFAVHGDGPDHRDRAAAGFRAWLCLYAAEHLTFSTLPRHMLTQGTAIFSLMRNIGGSIGISIVETLLAQNTQIVHSQLVEHLRPDNPLITGSLKAPYSLTDPSGIAALNAEATRQAAMVAYLDDFMLMMILVVIGLPLLLFLRRPRGAPASGPVAAD